MRLFARPNGSVDRYDRAAWLTPPFDLAWGVHGPYRVAAACTFRSGAARGEVFHSGAAAAGSFRSGVVIGQGVK